MIKTDHWDVLNADADLFWGVFGQEDYSARPIALFDSEAEAYAWLTWRESDAFSDLADNRAEERLPRHFYCVSAVRRLTGLAWNSFESPPTLDDTPTIEEVEEAP